MKMLIGTWKHLHEPGLIILRDGGNGDSINIDEMLLRQCPAAQTERQDRFGCLMWGQFDDIHVCGGSLQAIELVTTNPPMQSRRTGESTAASKSFRKESQGSGGLVEGMIELLRRKVCQQIPMLSRRRPMASQPLSLSLSHRLLAERVLPCEARPLQRSRSLKEALSEAGVPSFFGDLARQRDNERKPVCRSCTLAFIVS